MEVDGENMNTENTINLARIIAWILVLLWMGVIFAFSSQDVTASSQSSGVVSEVIYEVVEDTFPDAEISEDTFEFTLRNLAHFFLYFVLGIFVFNAIYSYKLKWSLMLGISVGISVLYALSDELHQYYVPGRAFELNDLLIDSLGAIVGILMLGILYSQRGKLKEI